MEKELYLYQKNELYDITVEINSTDSLTLKIHDSKKIENILNQSRIEYTQYARYSIVVDGIKTDRDKNALFYDLRNAKSIILQKEIYKG